VKPEPSLNRGTENDMGLQNSISIEGVKNNNNNKKVKKHSLLSQS
jgi:hypothetical protein